MQKDLTELQLFKDLKFVNLASQLVFLIEKYRLLVFNFLSSRFREGTKGNIEIRILLVWLVCRRDIQQNSYQK